MKGNLIIYPSGKSIFHAGMTMCLAFGLFQSLNAQTVGNVLVSGSNAKIVCTGAPQIVLNDISYHNEASSTHFVGANSTVKLIGSTATTFSSAAGYTTQVANLEMNKPSSSVTLNAPVSATGALTMTTGDFYTSAANVLTLGVSSPGVMNWTAGTVVGPMKRWFDAVTNAGNQSGLFPVGNVPTGAVLNRWTRIEYAAAPVAAGYLTVTFIGQNPSTVPGLLTNGLPLSETGTGQLNSLATEGYWQVDVAAASGVSGGSYDMTCRANSFNSALNYTQSRLVKSPEPHVTWTLNGTHGNISGAANDFTISRNGMAGFSYFAVAYPTTPLPVEMISFTAKCDPDAGYVNVNWITASENNSSHFILERSNDGSTWKTVNTQPAAGNSTSILEYTFVDQEARNYEQVYYRLWQYDIDGAYEMQSPIGVQCGNAKTEHAVYPNPSNGTFVLELNGSQSQMSNYDVQVKDSHGKVIYAHEYQVESGNGQYIIGLPEVAPGMYYLTISNEEANTQTIKLVFR